MGSAFSCCDSLDKNERSNRNGVTKPTGVSPSLKNLEQIEGTIKTVDQDVMDQRISHSEAINILKSLISDRIPTRDSDEIKKVQNEITKKIETYQNQKNLIQQHDGAKNVEPGEYSFLKTKLLDIKTDLDGFDKDIVDRDTKGLGTLAEEIKKRHQKINEIDTTSYPQLVKHKEDLQRQTSDLVNKVLEKIESDVKKLDAKKTERGSKYYEDMFLEINKIVITEEMNLKKLKDNKIELIKRLVEASSKMNKIEQEIDMLQSAMKVNTTLRLQSQTENVIIRSMNDLTSIDVEDDENLTKRKKEVMKKITEVYDNVKPNDITI